ncbi:hypothetical protein N7468_004004 [Penicillium chermesinum]|uniref:Uncharacterized protein n=1 Tax=Penicillium chermesinum TaxID=63820 RepID=A0A9W9P7Z5_9EURO|nr:uncharacterized protein N7468_004004 [Penicillium chermesinum]KAJ5239385.1 hypothetical protein N7468_004004 [Penicillium chermesinum]
MIRLPLSAPDPMFHNVDWSGLHIHYVAISISNEPCISPDVILKRTGTSLDPDVQPPPLRVETSESWTLLSRTDLQTRPSQETSSWS